MNDRPLFPTLFPYDDRRGMSVPQRFGNWLAPPSSACSGGGASPTSDPSVPSAWRPTTDLACRTVVSAGQWKCRCAQLKRDCALSKSLCVPFPARQDSRKFPVTCGEVWQQGSLFYRHSGVWRGGSDCDTEKQAGVVSTRTRHTASLQP